MNLPFTPASGENEFAFPTNNHEFLEAMACHLDGDECLWVCSFHGSPREAKDKWAGSSATYATLASLTDNAANNYCSVATFKAGTDGKFRRNEKCLARVFIVVLDDIGTKGDAPPLAPSYVIETSLGNFQVGYKLSIPITCANQARRLFRELTKKSRATDKSGNNPVRYVRLPFGANGKPEHTSPFPVHLAEWHPGRVYSLEEICEAFNLDSHYVVSAQAECAPQIHSDIDGLKEKNALGGAFALVHPPTEDNIQIVRNMLSHVPADNGIAKSGNREQWLQVMFSVASLLWGKVGENLLNEWSRPGLYDGRDFYATYHSYDHRRKGYTIATLIKFARDAGYSGPALQSRTSLETMSLNLVPPGSLNTTHDHGDILNGGVFVDLFRNRMKHVFTNGKWLRWDGQRWMWCEAGEEMEAAKFTARECVRRAATVYNSDPMNQAKKQALTHATKAHDVKRMDAMLKLAASDPDMGIGQIAQLDSDKMLLGVRNGVVDLRSGSLLTAVPKMLITRQCNAAFDRDASCSLWLQFLNTCFPDDPNMIEYLQKAIGYTLTGDVSEEVMHFCYGAGQNGKTVMANVLFEIMGDYAMVMRTESLMRNRQTDGGPSNDIARLQGARLVSVNETRSEQSLDDARMKELVSTEKISARFLHHEFFDFYPTHKIWMRGNHKPRIADTSDGAWRRMRLIPFDRQVPEGQADPNLENKLLAERDGILMWAAEGCVRWQQERLRPCTTVRAASDEYRSESDIFGQWMHEECTRSVTFEQDQAEVWNNWRYWCKQNGYREGTKNSFSRKLFDRGIKDGKLTNGKRSYIGLKCTMRWQVL